MQGLQLARAAILCAGLCISRLQCTSCGIWKPADASSHRHVICITGDVLPADLSEDRRHHENLHADSLRPVHEDQMTESTDVHLRKWCRLKTCKNDPITRPA